MKKLRDVLAQQEPSLHQSLLTSWDIAEHDWIPTLRMEGESHAGAPHLHSVEDWMDRLAEACRPRWSKHSSSPFGLNAMEIYILLASALFHDIGRGHPAGQRDKRPHGRVSREILDENWAQLGIVNARIAHEIGLICEYHTEPNLTWRHHDVTLIHPWGMVHTEALAAVLTLADELDTAYTRAAPPYMKDKELSIETGETIQSEVLDRMEEELFTKGLYRESIGSVEMDPGSHLIKTVLFAHRLPGPLEDAKPDSAAADWVKRHTGSKAVPKQFDLDDFFFSFLDVLANAKTGDPRTFLARQYYRAKDMHHMALLGTLRLPSAFDWLDDLERDTVLWDREAPVARPAMVTATLRAGSDLETTLGLIRRTVGEAGKLLDTKAKVTAKPKGAFLAANILEGVATSLWAAQKCRETVLREMTLGTEAANEALQKYATQPEEAYIEMLRELHEAVPVAGDYSGPGFRDAKWWKQDCWRMVDAAAVFVRAAPAGSTASAGVDLLAAAKRLFPVIASLREGRRQLDGSSRAGACTRLFVALVSCNLEGRRDAALKRAAWECLLGVSGSAPESSEQVISGTDGFMPADNGYGLSALASSLATCVCQLTGKQNRAEATIDVAVPVLLLGAVVALMPAVCPSAKASTLADVRCGLLAAYGGARSRAAQRKALQEAVRTLVGIVAGRARQLADSAEASATPLLQLAKSARELAEAATNLAKRLSRENAEKLAKGATKLAESARVFGRHGAAADFQASDLFAKDEAVHSGWAGAQFHSSVLVLMHSLTFLDLGYRRLPVLCRRGSMANLWQTPAMQVHLEARSIEEYHTNLSHAFQFYLRCVRLAMDLPLFDSRALTTTKGLTGAQKFLEAVEKALRPAPPKGTSSGGTGDKGGPEDGKSIKEAEADRKSRKTAFEGLKRSVDKVVSLWRRRHRQDGGILASDLRFAIRFMLMQWLAGDVKGKQDKLEKLQPGLRKLDIPFTDWVIEYSNQLFDGEWQVRIEPSLKGEDLARMFQGALKLWEGVHTQDYQIPWESLAAEVRDPDSERVRTAANRLDKLLFLYAAEPRWEKLEKPEEERHPHFWHFMAAQQLWDDASAEETKDAVRLRTGSSGWSVGGKLSKADREATAQFLSSLVGKKREDRR